MEIIFWSALFLVLGYLGLRYRHLWSLYRAQGAFKQGGLEAALVHYSKAHNTGNMTLRMCVTYGFLLLKSGKTLEAEKVLDLQRKKRRKFSPSNPEVCLIRTYQALVEWKKGNLDTAVEILQDHHALGYKTAAVFGSLGYFLLTKNKLNEALIINLEAQEYDSQDKVVLDNLALNYRLLGDLKAAGEVYDRLMSLDPQFPEAWYNYGLYLKEQGSIPQAKEALEKAKSLPLNALSTITQEEMTHALESL